MVDQVLAADETRARSVEDVVLDDDHAARREPVAAAAQEGHEVVVGDAADAPLEPDHVVPPSLRRKGLHGLADEPLDARRCPRQVDLGALDKLLAALRTAHARGSDGSRSAQQARAGPAHLD